MTCPCPISEAGKGGGSLLPLVLFQASPDWRALWAQRSGHLVYWSHRFR